tara:strand:+ start:306 stop:578 length:273 start_codon:yes stop_codon:yes gene_type:complete
MNMTKRQLNKKLKSSLLQGNDGGYIRNINLRVTRADKYNMKDGVNLTQKWTLPYTLKYNLLMVVGEVVTLMGLKILELSYVENIMESLIL